VHTAAEICFHPQDCNLVRELGTLGFQCPAELRAFSQTASTRDPPETEMAGAKGCQSPRRSHRARP